MRSPKEYNQNSWEADDLIPDTEIQQWYRGKSFSYDWTSLNFPLWTKLLSSRRQSVASVLEIGSWEGRSALFFLNYLPNCRIVCIDTFGGGFDHIAKTEFSEVLPHIESRFDANLADFKDRVQKIKAPSIVALPQLGICHRRFDLAFIDGSHQASDVYSDAVLTWSMLVSGAIMIFDDYQWKLMDDELQRPKLGVDAFLDAFENSYRILSRDYQIIIEKN